MKSQPPEWPPEDPRLTPISLRRELVAAGLTDQNIKRLLVAGVYGKVKRGAYADGAAMAQLDPFGQFVLRNRAAIKQAKTEVVLSHSSSAPEYDAPDWGLDLTTTHLTRVDGRSGRKEAGIQQHCGAIQDGDIVTRNGIQMMSATRTALEITTVASTEASLGFVNHALHHQLTTMDELVERYAAMKEWPFTLKTDIVLRLGRPEIESLGETRTFYLCHRFGIPMPEPQYEIRDAFNNIVARVDFAWPELGVFLEFDGRIKYEKLLREGERASDVVIREKAREEMICRLTGWRCIRITWADLERPERTAAKIVAVLEGR